MGRTLSLCSHGFLILFANVVESQRTPNAGAHLLPEAGARHERTLEAVRCSAWLDLFLLYAVSEIHLYLNSLLGQSLIPKWLLAAQDQARLGIEKQSWVHGCRAHGPELPFCTRQQREGA